MINICPECKRLIVPFSATGGATYFHCPYCLIWWQWESWAASDTTDRRQRNDWRRA